MNDIKFYDFEFNLLHIEPFAVSANFTVKFCGEGTFELHFPRNSEARFELPKNLNIKKGKGICMVFGKRSGIVTGFRLDNDFAVYGKTCDFIFEKKIVLPFENLEIYNPNEICAYFINSAFDETDVIEVISGSEVFENIYSEPFTEKYPKTLYNTIYTVLSDNGLGYCMNFNTELKKWTFEILNPSQTDKKFICDNKTAYDITVSVDTKDFFSHMLSKNGGGEYEFSEKYAAAGLYRWEEMSTQQNKPICDLDFKFISQNFEKDYFLGDKFKVFTEYGVFSVTVSEISLSYEGNIEKQNPKFTITEEE